MRLIHLSDLHLGYRQFQRTTPTGINQREADVAAVFRAAIDTVIARAPDLVLIAGDVFQNVRPPNPAILHAFAQFSRLVQALPDTLVLMVSGNHDTPRAVETGCILRLFTPLGIHVVDGEAKRLSFPERGLSVLAVPHMPRSARPALDPDPDFGINLLLLHGEMVSVVPSWADEERVAAAIREEELRYAQWSYVALGHYHVFKQLAPNACYTGSLEYTSPNIWGELGEEQAARLPGKGMVEFDLVSGKRTFHPIVAARLVKDLAPINARSMTAPEVDAAIRANVDRIRGGVADRVIRQVVRDIPRHVARELDQKQIRELRRTALHFHLDTRRPEVTRSIAGGMAGRRPSLNEIVREKLWSRQLPADVDRDALVELGQKYLRDAEAQESLAVAAVSEDM